MAYDPKTYQAPAWAQNLQGFEKKDARLAAGDDFYLSTLFMNSPYESLIPKGGDGGFNFQAAGEGMGFNSSNIPEGYQVAWNKKDNYGRAALLDETGKPVGSWEGAAHDSLTHDDYATMAGPCLQPATALPAWLVLLAAVVLRQVQERPIRLPGT